ncbi:Crp/Fnr family transcriptional regulator [Aquisalinus flavus]|nr:Crp/Fnr family transcriptional regulator [Aquisalinus flavus]
MRGTDTPEIHCGKTIGAMNFCSLCDVRPQSICAEMNEDEIRAISKTMAHHSVKEGHAIATEGEPVSHLNIIVSGTFRLVRMLEDGRRQITGFMFPGDFVGMSRGDSSYTAEALEPSLICSFAHNFLDQMSEKHPGIKDRLIARGSSELAKAQDHIVLLGKNTAEERVLSFLKLIGRARRGDDRLSTRIYLSMPRQDIADFLGLRMETLSRTFAKLKKTGHLKTVSGRFVELGEAFERAG